MVTSTRITWKLRFFRFFSISIKLNLSFWNGHKLWLITYGAQVFARCRIHKSTKSHSKLCFLFVPNSSKLQHDSQEKILKPVSHPIQDLRFKKSEKLWKVWRKQYDKYLKYSISMNFISIKYPGKYFRDSFTSIKFQNVERRIGWISTWCIIGQSAIWLFAG